MKKTKYLVAALLLMGATTTFTSCIDNDEPAGIEELRGAKAELLKAKAAVELANEAFVRAKVAEQEALNKGIEIANAQKELALEAQKVELAMQEARNEVEKAKLASQKQTIEQQMALNAEEFKAQMLNAQKQTAFAQKAYDDAMKALELSKLTMPDDVRAIVNRLENNVNGAYALYVSARETYQAANTKLNKVLEEFTPIYDKKDLELVVEECKLDIEAAEFAVKVQEEILAKDVTTYLGWEEELKEIDAQLAVKDTLLAQTRLDIQKIKNSEEGRALYKLVKAERDTLNWAYADYKNAFNGGVVNEVNYNFAMPSFKVDFSDNEPLVKWIEAANQGTVYTQYFKDGKFAFSGKGLTYTQNSYTAVKGKIPSVVAMNQVKALMKVVAGPHAEDVAWYERDLAEKKTALEKANKAYDAVYKKWEEAVDNFINGKEYSQASYDKAVAGVKGLLNGVTTGAYNTDALKTAAYSEYAAFVNEMRANGQKFADDKLIDGITDFTKLDAAAKADASKLYPAAYTPAGDREKALDIASQNAFGDLYRYVSEGVSKPRLTAPTADELAAARSKHAKGEGTYGQLGNVWTAEDAVTHCNQRIALAESIVKLNADVLAAEKAMNEKIAANSAKVMALYDAFKVAESEYNVAVEAYDNLTKELEDLCDKVSEERDALWNVKNAIRNAMFDVNGDPYMSSEEVVVALKKNLVLAKRKVAEAEAALERAEQRLAQFVAGNYTKQTEIENAKEDLAFFKDQLDQAHKNYEAAVAELNKVLAELAK